MDELVGASSPSSPLPSIVIEENSKRIPPVPAPSAWNFEVTQKLIRGNRKPTKEVRLSFIKNDNDVVIMPENEIDHDWDFTLIGYFTGRYTLKSHDSG